MSLRDDDKEYFRQLGWIYPAEYVNELKKIAQEILKEQLLAGERQNIREIVHNIIKEISSTPKDETDQLNREYDAKMKTQLEKAQQAAQMAAADRAEALLEKMSAALSSGQAGVLAGLGPEAVVFLVEAMNIQESIEAQTAYKALLALEDSWAIDAFCRLWADTRRPDLEEILTSKGYLAARPPNLRTLTVLKTGAAKYMLSMNKQTVVSLLNAAADADSQIAFRAKEMLLSLDNQQSIDALCEKALENSDDERLLSLVLAGKYVPAPESRAAIFYCLTGQWEKYYALDCQENRPLVLEGYSKAKKTEKKRFLSLARKEGHNALVIQTLLNTGQEEPFEKITASDWTETILAAAVRQEWSYLYRLLFRAPIRFAAQIIYHLTNAGWHPPSKEEDIWRKIVNLCPQPDRKYFVPDGRETMVLILEEPGVNLECLAFHPNGQIVAAGGSDGVVRFWRLKEKRLWRSVSLAEQGVSALAFSPDGSKLAVAGLEGKVNIWKMPDIVWAQAVKGKTGIVTDLAVNEKSEILACAKDNKNSPLIRLWHWDGDFMTNKAQLPRYAFSAAAVHPELNLVLSGAAAGYIRSWPLKGGTQGQRLPLKNQGEIIAMAINAGGEIAAAITSNNRLNIWSDNELLASLPIGRAQKGDRLALSSQGDLAAVSSLKNNTIAIYNTYWSKPLDKATEADRQYVKKQAGLSDSSLSQKAIYEFLDAIFSAKFGVY